MIIPKAITVGRNWFVTYWVDRWTSRNAEVQVDPPPRSIRMARLNAYSGKKNTPAQLTENYLHELTHAILYDMKHPLWKDETFVTAFAKRLAKAVDSAEL